VGAATTLALLNYLMTREQLIAEADLLAERLVAIGDMDSFEQIFGSRDPNLDLKTFPTERLQDIYDENIKD